MKEARDTPTEAVVAAAELDYCGRFGIPVLPGSRSEVLREMAAFRPAHSLYQSQCGLSGRSILTSMPPGQGYTVYAIDDWLSDGWDPLSFGRPYNFTRPFFDQFGELARSTPLPSVSSGHASIENCDFCNFVSGSRNCYLVFSGSHLEDCLYGRFLFHSKDLADCFYAKQSELCYGCRDIQSCYHLVASAHCLSCSDSAFLDGCRSCRNCYGCVNLAQREYCWWNEQLSRGEWERRRNEVDLTDRAVYEQEAERFRTFRLGQPTRAVYGSSFENSSGNYLNQVAACTNSFLVSESESLDSCIWMNQARMCFTVLGFGNHSELLYRSSAIGTNTFDVKFSLQCRAGVRELEYCMNVEAGSTNCFGCVSLRDKHFCVLNRQYSEAEYRELVPRIKEHMRATGEYGRFFPPALNPYAYNESDGALFFPVAEATSVALGWRWAAPHDTVAGEAQPPPRHLADLSDTALSTAYRCKITGRPFRLQRRELELLRGIGAPPPAASPFERIRLAGAFLAWRELLQLPCGLCAHQGVATGDPEGRTTLCADCYQQLLMG